MNLTKILSIAALFVTFPLNARAQELDRSFDGSYAIIGSNSEEYGGHFPKEMPVRIASMSKQITSVLIFRAKEKGLLNLDQKLGEYFPKIENAATASVTIRQLLTHTSGLPNPEDGDLDSNGYSLYYQKRQRNHNACLGPAGAEKMGKFNYNNCDYMILGDILQIAFKKRLKAILRDELILPYGLETLTIRNPRNKATRPVNEPKIYIENYGASGGFYMSLQDIAKFDRALWNFELISKSSFEEMTIGNPQFGYAAMGMWAYRFGLPRCERDVFLVERRGEIGNVRIVNLIAPELKKAIVLYSNQGADFGNLYTGSGTLYDFAAASFCPKT